jgi:hypothetical protein
MIDLQLGNSNVTVRIIGVESKKVNLDNETSADKMVLITETREGNKFNVDEVLIKQKESLVTRGLWIIRDDDKNILSTSTLGRFLNFLQVKTVKDLMGKEITLAPKDNQFMAAIAYK